MKSSYDLALELMLQSKPDIKRVTLLLNKGVEEGNSDSAYALGTWYLLGKNLEKDMCKAIDLLTLADDLNHPDACFDLAICYEKSEGISQDLERAFHLYLRAALYGDEQSFSEVGRCYYHGIGTKPDEVLADIWLEKTEALGIDGIEFYNT